MPLPKRIVLCIDCGRERVTTRADRCESCHTRQSQVERLCPSCHRQRWMRPSQSQCDSCRVGQKYHASRKPLVPLRCRTCRAQFVPSNRRQIYCARKCNPARRWKQRPILTSWTEHFPVTANGLTLNAHVKCEDMGRNGGVMVTCPCCRLFMEYTPAGGLMCRHCTATIDALPLRGACVLAE